MEVPAPQEVQQDAVAHAQQRHEEVLDRRSANRRNYVAHAPKFEIGKISWNDYKIRLTQYVRGDRYESDNDTVKRAIFAGMQGEAFTTISSYGPDVAPYNTMTGDDYLTYLGSFFAPSSERGMWRVEYQSRVQRKNETVIPYLSAKWNLWLKLYGNEADRHFEEFEDSALQGFSNREVAKGVSDKDCNNFEELMDAAQKVVAKVNRQIKLKLIDSKNMEGLGTSTMITFNSCQTPMEIGAVEEVQVKKERKCWGCGLEGHFRRECPNASNTEKPGTTGQNYSSRGRGQARGGQSSRGGQSNNGGQYNRGGQSYRGGNRGGSSNRGQSSSRGWTNRGGQSSSRGWKNNVHEIDNQEEEDAHVDTTDQNQDDWDNWTDQNPEQEGVNSLEDIEEVGELINIKIIKEVITVEDEKEDIQEVRFKNLDEGIEKQVEFLEEIINVDDSDEEDELDAELVRDIMALDREEELPQESEEELLQQIESCNIQENNEVEVENTGQLKIGRVYSLNYSAVMEEELEKLKSLRRQTAIQLCQFNMNAEKIDDQLTQITLLKRRRQDLEIELEEEIRQKRMRTRSRSRSRSRTRSRSRSMSRSRSRTRSRSRSMSESRSRSRSRSMEAMIDEIPEEMYEEENLALEEEDGVIEDGLEVEVMPDLMTDESEYESDWDSEDPGYVSALSEIPEIQEEEEVENDEFAANMEEDGESDVQENEPTLDF